MEFRRLPQSPTLPESWRALLDAFRPAFRRSRTFALFALLATGLVTQTTRRTVVGMLAGAGMAAVVSFHAVCRFFSHHAFDIDRLGLTLARLIVSRLLAADAVIDVVVDATLFRRWGPKVVGAFRTHDGSAQDPNALGRGNRWIIIGIVVAVPFCAHPVPTGAVPVVARPGHRLPVQLARELTSILAQVFPDRLVHAVGEPPTTARRCWCPLPRSPPGRPANAALYALAPPRTGKRCSRWSRNAATSGGSRFSICSSEGDTWVRSAVKTISSRRLSR
jgi:DDE superfamily endonuclease